MNMRGVWLLGLVAFGGLLTFVSATQAPADRQPEQAVAEPPHDLILTVDVSLSMIMDWTEGTRTFPASDREGMRWDGLQFAVDVARPQDRVALVLYRAENIILSKFIDDTGFVGLAQKYPKFGNRTGRELLTALITEMQQQEDSWGKKLKQLRDANQPITKDTFSTLTFALLKDGPGASVSLPHGTASLLALKTVEKDLLPQVRPGAQAWTFLFTDGVEVGPNRPGQRFPAAAYAYIKEREGLSGPRLRHWVDPWVKQFRARGAPVFTFALGDDCDRPLLRALAQQSSTAGPQGRAAASYELQNNVQLLGTLQHILWELREYWMRPLEPDRRDQRQELFSTPRVQIWHDLGVLLYRQAADGRARAPLDADMRPPRLGDRELDGLRPLKSRSHWYYHLSPSAKDAKQAGLAGELEFEVRHSAKGEKYVTRAVAAFRTQQSLFHFRAPAAGGKPYTPRDAIPFVVEFTPYAVMDGDKRAVPFQVADFDVEATFAPAARPGAKARTFKLSLQPLADPPDDARLAPRQFRAELILDSNAKSAGRPGLTGAYDVDVLITGIKGPLAGARRQLLRRTLEVAPYPTLTVPQKIVLTNDGPDTARAVVPLTFDQRTDPAGVVTDVTVELTRGPIARKDEVKPGLFQLGPRSLQVQGKQGKFTLELAAAAWAKLPRASSRTVRWSSASPGRASPSSRK